MKNYGITAAAALLVAGLSTAAFGQAGANMNAPQPSSSGAGVIQPGTTSTGRATQTGPGSTVGAAPMATGSETGNNAASMHGSNSAAGGGLNATEGRSNGGGGGAGAGH
jgi:hypothetical protein